MTTIWIRIGAILALKILSGMDTGNTEINPDADVGGDGKIGMREVIYLLQSVTELRF